MKRTISVTPAFNEEKTIENVIKNTKKYVTFAIVVDDCSSDDTWLKSMEGDVDILIRNVENMGQGYSLKTGIKFALNLNPDAIITVDADAQHDPSHIPKLIKPIVEDGFDVVVGARKEGIDSMPFIKRIGNFGLNLMTRALFGIKCSDSQSGFRAYSPDAARELDFLIHRYGWASIMYTEISEKHLRYIEVPISCIYLSPKKGTTVLDGIWIGFQLLNFKRIHLEKRIFGKGNRK